MLYLFSLNLLEPFQFQRSVAHNIHLTDFFRLFLILFLGPLTHKVPYKSYMHVKYQFVFMHGFFLYSLWFSQTVHISFANLEKLENY